MTTLAKRQWVIEAPRLLTLKLSHVKAHVFT
jgi:hypothetical protein